jgi:hypothetical protein
VTRPYGASIPNGYSISFYLSQPNAAQGAPLYLHDSGYSYQKQVGFRYLFTKGTPPTISPIFPPAGLNLALKWTSLWRVSVEHIVHVDDAVTLSIAAGALQD